VLNRIKEKDFSRTLFMIVDIVLMNSVLKAYAKVGDPEGAIRVSYLIFLQIHLALHLIGHFLITPVGVFAPS
jgi:pentatricopeptide repeat protein